MYLHSLEEGGKRTGHSEAVRFAGVVVVAAALLVPGLGCTTRKPADTNASLPLVSASPVPQPGENIEAVSVQIVDGHFDSDIYTQLPGARRMIVKT